MSMTQREKLLAAGVGAVAILFLGQTVWSSVQSGFQEKRDRVAALDKQKKEQDLLILQGAESSKKINKLLPRSLSKKEEFARADYVKWLIELAKKVQLEEPTERSMGDTRDKDGFHVFKFQLAGSGTLQNVVELLHEFHSKPYLHRVTRFDIRPSSNPKDGDRITMTLDCEVLSMPLAKEVQPAPKANYGLLAKSLDDYKTTILNRNLFGPPNQPPQLAATKTVEATKGVRVDYTVEAKDPDQTHKVQYELLGDAPTGLTVDPNTGKVNWTGNELGEYKFKVLATDTGIPAKSSQQLVTIKVKDLPPPPPPQVSFDIASQARLSGLVTGRDGAEGWIYSKTDSKTIKLRKGGELKLGSVMGKVVDVGANFIELETDGRRWTLGIEESVAEAYQRGQVD